MVVTYKDWHNMLPFALHGYRTSVRTSTRATPFSLVYGMEAVLPFEVEIPSLRMLMEIQLEEAEWVQARRDQLNFIDEKRLDLANSKGSQREVDTKLRRPLRGEKGPFKRSTNPREDGWGRVTSACQLGHNQNFIYNMIL